ncbi:MAG: RDD family protein [Lachnospiraceae bacterium]
MISDNNINFKQRLVELMIDYIYIIAYLLVLLGFSMGFYYCVLGEIPAFKEINLQLLVFLCSVLPVILFFSITDFNKGSIGKNKARLRLYYNHKSFKSSLLRNIFKFLPWHLAHMGVIHGMYSNFDWLSLALTYVSMVFAIIMLLMGLLRKDKRHIGDLIAGTQVQEM